MDGTGHEFDTGAVDTGKNTIDLGSSSGLSTGAEVIYHNGGGGNISGLNDGGHYFVRDEGGGNLKLYNTAQDANNDTNAITLGSQGSSTHQSLSTSNADDNAGTQAQSGTGVVTGGLSSFSGSSNANSSSSRVQSGTQSASGSISSAAPTQSSISGRENAAPTPPGTSAIIQSGTNVVAGDDIGVKANEHAAIDATIGQVAGGVVGAGAAVAVLSIADNVTASAGGTLSAGGDISVLAMLNENVNVLTLDGATGFVGLGAAVAVVNDSSATSASLADGAQVHDAASITVSATADRTLSLLTGQASVSAFSTGASFTRLSVNGDTSALIGDNAQIGQGSGDVVGDVNVTADETIDAHGQTVAIGAGAVAVSANFSFVDVGSNVSADIGTSAHIASAGAVNVTADGELGVNAEVFTATGGLGATGASIAHANLTSDVTAGIAAFAVVSAGGNIAVETRLNSNGSTPSGKKVKASAEAPSVGVGASLTGTDAEANMTSAVTASVGSGAQLTAGGNVTVDAASARTVNSLAAGTGISLGVGIGVSVASAEAGGSTRAKLDGSATATGDITVQATEIDSARAYAQAVASGIVSAGANSATATITPTLEASIGNSATISAGGDLSLLADAVADTQADAFGISAGGFSIGASIANATTSPTIDTHIGSSNVTAGGGISLTSLFNRNADGSIVTTPLLDATGNPLGSNVAMGARATATTASGSLLLSAEGGLANATVSPSISTYVGAGSTLNAGGAVALSSRANEEADANATGVGVSAGVAVGATLPTATIGGSILTHFDGTLASGDSLALTSQVDTHTEATGYAVGGALLASGNGTDVNATISQNIQTYIGGAGHVTVDGDVSLATLLRTDAEAVAASITLSGGLAAGATPANATINASELTAIQGGATVTSANGSVSLLSANNYDPDTSSFITGTGATVSTKMLTAALGVAISDSNITATAHASVDSEVGGGATIDAANGDVKVESRSSNYAEARMENDGGGAVNVSVSNPDAEAGGLTQARLLGNVTHAGTGAGANNVFVTAQGSDVAAAGASSSGGGIVSVGTSNVTAHAAPNVNAQGGGQIRAGGDITIQSVSTTDADASSRSASGGAVDVSILNADASSSPNVGAGVASDAILAAGGTLTISAVHGVEPAPLADGSFNAATAVNTATNTIDLGANTGLLTGDTVTYNAQGGAALGGVVDGRTYGVIFVTDQSLQLGATFNTGGSSTAVDVNRDTISFASADNLQDGDSVIYHAAGSFGVGGLVEGHRYLVHVVNATTIKLVDPNNLPAAAQAFTGSTVAGNTITITGHGFTNGQAVTYRAPAAPSFGTNAVDVEGGSSTTPLADADNNNIYLGAGHGLQNGDTVIYTASDPSKPIDGLTSGERYVVIFDSSKPDEVQLALEGSPTTAIDLHGPDRTPRSCTRCARSATRRSAG